MLKGAKQHFDEDIERAEVLCSHAKNLPASVLKDDILRAAWMMAVGACDAFFCDAYADLISRTLRAKDLEPSIDVPDRLNIYESRLPQFFDLVRAGGAGGWSLGN